MTTQATAALISFAGIAAMIGVFLFVLSRSRKEAPYAEVQPRAYAIRKWFFLVLLVGFFVVPALTLRSLPYTVASEGTPATVVEATAHQWRWELSTSEVFANQPIVFRVTSEDVNHGFGIYDESSRLIAQVQAMPGYVSELAVEFDSPGSYKVLCLEYCGLAHHVMESVIKVVAPATPARSQEKI